MLVEFIQIFNVKFYNCLCYKQYHEIILSLDSIIYVTNLEIIYVHTFIAEKICTIHHMTNDGYRPSASKTFSVFSVISKKFVF